MINAYEILAKAYENAELSARYFDYFNEESENTEMREIYWTNTMEYNGKASAYLDVYKMITGKNVINITCAIREEMEICRATQINTAII